MLVGLLGNSLLVELSRGLGWLKYWIVDSKICRFKGLWISGPRMSWVEVFKFGLWYRVVELRIGKIL